MKSTLARLKQVWSSGLSEILKLIISLVESETTSNFSY